MRSMAAVVAAAVLLGGYDVGYGQESRSIAAKTSAKELFGRKRTPASLQAAAIGFYTHVCLAGGIALPINGKTWQVMRLSRNRNWGHPVLVRFLERLAERTPKVGWRGLLVSALGAFYVFLKYAKLRELGRQRD